MSVKLRKEIKQMVERSIVRSTSRQIKHLVDFIEAYVEAPEYAEARMHRDSNVMLPDNVWKQVALELNGLGPPERPWQGWRKVWNTISAEARRKERSSQKSSSRPRNTPLTHPQKKTLKILKLLSDLKKAKRARPARNDRSTKTPDDTELPTSADPLDITEESMKFGDTFDPMTPVSLTEASSLHDLQDDSLPQSQNTEDLNLEFTDDDAKQDRGARGTYEEVLSTIEESNHALQESLDGIKGSLSMAVGELKAIRAIQEERLDIERSKLKLEKERLQLMREELAFKKSLHIEKIEI